MKITLSGDAGSGKSTLAKMLAENLGLKEYSSGDSQRFLAKQAGVSLEEWGKRCEEDPETDLKVDAHAAEIGKTKDNFVLVGRVAYYFIPDSVKIYLQVDFETGARRIYEDPQDTRKVEKYKTLKDLMQSLKTRRQSEINRYEKYYKLNPYDLKQYDIVIDTTSITAEQATQKVIDFLKNKPLNNDEESQ